jgi:lipopolysaccharide export system protein LptA
LKQIIFIKKIPTITLFSIFFLTSFFTNINPLFAGTEFSKKTPLNITSDSMFAKKSGLTIEFKGHVVATKDDAVIHADSLILFFKKIDNKNKIDKIISTGNVKYFSNERTAYADKAVYTYADEVLVLTGKNPKVITGDNSVTGKKITIFQKDGRISVMGGVHIIINPDDKTIKKDE